MKKLLSICLLSVVFAAIAGDTENKHEESTTPLLIEMLRVKDQQTGEIRKPTADELRLLFPQNPLARSHEGLAPRVNKNGDVELDLQGRFQCATVAKIGPDGKVIKACVHSDHQARAFLILEAVEVDHDR